MIIISNKIARIHDYYQSVRVQANTLTQRQTDTYTNTGTDATKRDEINQNKEREKQNKQNKPTNSNNRTLKTKQKLI